MSALFEAITHDVMEPAKLNSPAVVLPNKLIPSAVFDGLTLLTAAYDVKPRSWLVIMPVISNNDTNFFRTLMFFLLH